MRAHRHIVRPVLAYQPEFSCHPDFSDAPQYRARLDVNKNTVVPLRENPAQETGRRLCRGRLSHVPAGLPGSLRRPVIKKTSFQGKDRERQNKDD